VKQELSPCHLIISAAMAGDGREKKKKKQGGFRTMPFILGELV